MAPTATHFMACPTADGPVPAQINGVSLLTRAGVPKSRYTFDEKLRLLGCTEEQIRAFADLFAPRKFDYAVTRVRSANPRDWSSGRGPLTLDRVARHLLGARLPGLNPQWVAPRGWDWTLFVAVDVDRRGDPDEFLRRCRKLEETLAVLEVPPESLLIVPTPSGGRHYYFFTAVRIRTAEIAPTLAKVGIVVRKGKFELFPSPSQGLRLPFGHIPGNPHAPNDWLHFLARSRTGALPTVNWERCKHLAREKARSRGNQRHLFPDEPDEPDPGAGPGGTDDARRATVGVHHRSAYLRTPKRGRNRNAGYDELVSRPVCSPSDIEELWALGIREVGTRHEAVLRLAWNFIFVRGCEEDRAVEEITGWAYRTGEFTSKDVRADLRGNGKRVEEDVRDLVRHFARLRDAGSHRTGGRFAEVEVNTICRATADLDPRQARLRGRFLLEFLRFAKSHGRPVEGGWECAPAVRGIIQDWPGCSGMRYKAHLDWARDAGILVLTREKRQTPDRTGRARTYLLRMPHTGSAESVLTQEEAITLLLDRPGQAGPIPADAVREELESDTYQVGLPPKEEDGLGEAAASDPAVTGVGEHIDKGNNRASDQTTLPGPGTQSPVVRPELRRTDHAERPDEPARAAGDGAVDVTGPGDGEPPARRGGGGDAGRQHPRRPLRRLAEGTPERPGVEPPVQGVRDPRPGRVRAVPAGRTGRALWPGLTLRPGLPDLATFSSLPPPHDHAAIAAILAPFRQRALDEFPDQATRVQEIWTAVESLARDPTLHPSTRRLVLADPADLMPAEILVRLRLLKEHRRTRDGPVTVCG